jgi:hypothetical protein
MYFPCLRIASSALGLILQTESNPEGQVSSRDEAHRCTKRRRSDGGLKERLSQSQGRSLMKEPSRLTRTRYTFSWPWDAAGEKDASCDDVYCVQRLSKPRRRKLGDSRKQLRKLLSLDCGSLAQTHQDVVLQPSRPVFAALLKSGSLCTRVPRVRKLHLKEKGRRDKGSAIKFELTLLYESCGA